MPLSSLFRIFDRYSWKARVRPLILAILPIAMPAVAAAPAWPHGRGTWWLVPLAGVVLLAEPMGRARGKRLESSLFASWGGKPSVQMLRYSGPTSESYLAHLRTRVQEIAGPSVLLPSKAEEDADPSKADEVYETACTILRARARVLPGTYLLAEHDGEYGFRRNALGLRALALAACLVGLTGLAGVVAWAGVSGYRVNAATIILWSMLIIGELGLLAFWLVVARPTWVEEAAWDYARQLHETVNLPDAASGTAA